MQVTYLLESQENEEEAKITDVTDDKIMYSMKFVVKTYKRDIYKL